jgi:hypothetical protein
METTLVIKTEKYTYNYQKDGSCWIHDNTQTGVGFKREADGHISAQYYCPYIPEFEMIQR